ncbi:MAG: hypothetical protein IJ594_10005 [Oscillospiraceae bacterium]|nr:hypothetical protein [Oscillospiraceae bacterium]
MREKTLKLLGLMRRANAISIGETNTAAAVQSGKTRLLLLAADASDNARKRASSFAAGRSFPIVELPFTKEEVSAHVGVGGCSMAAVTDMGFADALMRLLAAQWPEAYGVAAEETAARYERMKRRRRGANDSSKRIGKRRTDV